MCSSTALNAALLVSAHRARSTCSGQSRQAGQDRFGNLRTQAHAPPLHRLRASSMPSIQKYTHTSAMRNNENTISHVAKGGQKATRTRRKSARALHHVDAERAHHRTSVSLSLTAPSRITSPTLTHDASPLYSRRTWQACSIAHPRHTHNRCIVDPPPREESHDGALPCRWNKRARA